MIECSAIIAKSPALPCRQRRRPQYESCTFFGLYWIIPTHDDDESSSTRELICFYVLLDTVLTMSADAARCRRRIDGDGGRSW